MTEKMEIGKIGWIDISVRDAPALRDFYSAVAGWVPKPVDMGDYSDYTMTLPGSGEAAAGICHARGINEDLPNQWLIYIVVADVNASATSCVDNGGKVLVPPRPLGDAKFCVIQDPSGAIAGLYQDA